LAVNAMRSSSANIAALTALEVSTAFMASYHPWRQPAPTLVERQPVSLYPFLSLMAFL
jgi:hypothetical protein